MWDDRFLFVTAALAASAYWIAFDRRERDSSDGQNGLLAWVTGRTVTLALIVVVGGRLWQYWQDISFPTPGSVLAILIGAVFGAFTAKFIRSLFGEDFGPSDPFIGAGVLALLSIAYSLPLYSQAISGLFGGLGLASIKTPVLELTLREAPGGRGAVVSASGAGGAGNFSAQAVPRASDPSPGLSWLKIDSQVMCPPDQTGCSGTFADDKAYIDYVEFPEADYPPEYKTISAASVSLLTPVQQLSRCLSEYVKIVPDSQLLLVDIKPMIEALFQVHARAKRELRESNEDPKTRMMSVTGLSLVSILNKVMKTVSDRYNTEDKLTEACREWSSAADPETSTDKDTIEYYYLQPYGTLILSDLLIAHGAPDEAIRVLAEWLNLWDDYASAPVLPDWFKIRVASRLTLLMKNLAGQSNIAYREFFQYYKNSFEYYAADSPRPLSLDRYPDRCKAWASDTDAAADDTDATPSNTEAAAEDRKAVASNTKKAKSNIEQRIFYLLLANEDEALRTQISFLSEENNFEALEKLVRRARFMASIGPECLPKSFDDKNADKRKAIVADHQITAGLLGLAVSERMASIARSSGDRERAGKVRDAAEDQLRKGWEDLRPRVLDDREDNRKKLWSERIFAESDWENSASLATRALFQLRRGEN